MISKPNNNNKSNYDHDYITSRQMKNIQYK